MTTETIAGVPTQLGHVALRVHDVDRSIEWYTEILGLKLKNRMRGVAFLGIREDASHEVALFPLPAEPANRISRPSAVQSRAPISHTPNVICFAAPPAVPSRWNGITNTPELKVLVRRTNASMPPSGEKVGDMSAPADGLVSWWTSPPSIGTANRPCPAVKTKNAPPGDHARSPLVAPFDIEICCGAPPSAGIT